MNRRDTLALASQAATLMEQFERRCAELERQQRQLAQPLEKVAQSLPGAAARSVQETLQRVPDALIRQVRNGIDEPVAGFEKRLQHAGRLLREGAPSLAVQLKRVERMQRLLLWKGAAVTLGSLLLLLAGGGWPLMQYRPDRRDNQLRAELLRAYNAADVTLCEGRLCANTETQGPPTVILASTGWSARDDARVRHRWDLTRQALACDALWGGGRWPWTAWPVKILYAIYRADYHREPRTTHNFIEMSGEGAAAASCQTA